VWQADAGNIGAAQFSESRNDLSKQVLVSLSKVPPSVPASSLHVNAQEHYCVRTPSITPELCQAQVIYVGWPGATRPLPVYTTACSGNFRLAKDSSTLEPSTPDYSTTKARILYFTSGDAFTIRAGAYFRLTFHSRPRYRRSCREVGSNRSQSCQSFPVEIHGSAPAL
jgi:hypothetical protein